MPPAQVVFSLAGIIIVIIGCYYTVYYIGVKASGKNRGRLLRNRNINMLDRFAISKDKSFCLIEIAGKVYVVGVTNQSITLLDTLDASVFAEAAVERREAAGWPSAQGNQHSSRLVNRLSYYLAGKIRALRGNGNSGGAGSGSFEDSMKEAREKGASESSDRTRSDRPDDSEGDV